MTTGNNAINTQLPFVVGGSGTYTTIQAAINAAALIATSSNKQTVLINPGSYTENLTLKSFVNLSDFDGSNGSVNVIGNAVYNALADNESIALNGVGFTTPGGGGIALSIIGTKIVTVDIHHCTITGSTGTAFSCTNTSATVIKDNCHLFAGAGQKICDITGGTVKVIAGFATATDTASTISGSTIFQILSCFDTNAFVVTGTVTMGVENSVVVAPGTLTFVDLGVGCTLFLVFSSINSNAASFYVTGSGNLILGGSNPLLGSAINIDPAINFVSSTTDIGTLRLLKQSTAIDMNSHLINNVTDPSSPQDAATKHYVDSTALNGTSVYAASTVNVNATQAGAGPGATLTDASGTFAVFALDGVNPPLQSNVLVKNYATAQNEGIYTLTRQGDGVSIPWQLTRATTYDTPTEINRTGLIVIQNGTQAGQAWYNAATIITVDTTPFNYVRFGTTGTVTNIATSNGVVGGPITSTGTIELGTMFSINASATANSFVMDANGLVTLPNNPSFSAYVTANSAAVTGDGTVYTIASYTIYNQVGTGFDVTTGIFTAPVTGIYQFSATIVLNGLGAGNTNGNAWFAGTGAIGNNTFIDISSWAAKRSSNNQVAFSGSTTLLLAAGTTVKLDIQEASNGSKNVIVAGGSAFTQFGGMLIS